VHLAREIKRKYFFKRFFCNTGYYRVNYDPKNWRDLSKTLQQDHQKIHQLNRAQILDDSFQLVLANSLSCETALELSQYLTKEEDLIPWQAALNSFSQVESMIDEEDEENLKKYMFRLLTPIFKRLGFKGDAKDSHLTVLLRRFAFL
jgi:aminopeptidase N